MAGWLRSEVTTELTEKTERTRSHERSKDRGRVEPNEISGTVVDAAMTVHRALGPGLLESAYRICLAHELRRRGLEVLMEVELPVTYEGITVSLAYRIDLVVEPCVVVETKTVSKIHPVHEAQLLSHLKLSGYRIGLLINFHVPRLKDGIRRMVV